jgi:predicted nucleotidyltransferase
MKKLIEKNKKKLEKIFKKEGVVLAYLFGSVARGKMGPLSDIDIAVLFSEKVRKEKFFDKRLELASEIDEALKTYKTEVICLNEAPPLLKHRAVFYGIPIFISNSKLKREFEFRVLQEYEDFRYHLETAYKIMRRQIKEGVFGKPLISIYSKPPKE